MINSSKWLINVHDSLRIIAARLVIWAAWCERKASNIRLGASLRDLNIEARTRQALREFDGECELISRLYRDELDEAESNSRTPSAVSKRLAVVVDSSNGSLITVQSGTPLHIVK